MNHIVTPKNNTILCNHTNPEWAQAHGSRRTMRRAYRPCRTPKHDTPTYSKNTTKCNKASI